MTTFISSMKGVGPEHPFSSQKRKLMDKANQQIQDGLEKIRLEANEIKTKLEEKKVEDSPPPAPVREATPTPSSQITIPYKPLVYFSYPILGYDEPPPWTTPLRELLVQLGYLVYNPWDAVGAQFGKGDLPYLNALPKKIVKSLCSTIYVPEEVLYPYEAVAEKIFRGDQGESDGIVFKDLWFLVRSSLIVVDLIRPMVGAGTAHELLYAKLLGVPSLGIFPDSGRLSPWVHRTVSVLLTTELNPQTILPLISAYAPLPAR